ncbi:hypothetical protein D6745_03465, partial [Candidatus Woesearchaeota archaeon]
ALNTLLRFKTLEFKRQKVFIRLQLIALVMPRESLFFAITILLLITPCVFSATIHGSIYDMNLEAAKNSVIRVNSVPEQVFVAKNGSYSFTLPKGDYIIKADYNSDNIDFSAEENITIKEEGDYVLDIILFPDISTEESLLDEDISFSDVDIEEKDSRKLWLYFIVVTFLTVSAYIILKKKSKMRKKRIIVREEDQAKEVLDFIKRNDGRVTQKEIRKQFPFSEAKVSLILTELEEKGLIKKIKRGKGNIIILDEK